MTRDEVAIAPVSDHRESRRTLLRAAHRRGFVHYVVRDPEDVIDAPGTDHYLDEATRLSQLPRTPSSDVLPVAVVSSVEELRSAIDLASSTGSIAIRFAKDRVIPLEDVVAHRGSQFRVWAIAPRPGDVPAALGALEHGADRVIAEIHSITDLEALDSLLEPELPLELNWQHIDVSRVVSVGTGDRVIVDTTSLLRPAEGLLIGSSAGFLFHIASEAVGSAFTRPREFRVNAGAAHSYALLADGTTRYLAELSPGDAVLIAEPRGSIRSARVGRLKIERRPLVMVQGRYAGREFTVFLQEAETVRLSTDTEHVPTTQLRAGTAVLGVALPEARHLGRVVEETITER
jgi:3-dehydroquinate synthase II